MADSSYEKVYQRIHETKQCKALLASIPPQIEDIHVIDVEFRLSRPDELGQPATAYSMFKVRVPGGEIRTTDGSVSFDMSSLLGESRLRPLIEEVFGMPGGVPTYFCRKSVVNGRDYRKGTRSFSDWLIRQVGSRYEEALAKARKRVEQEVAEWKVSDHVLTKQRDFLVQCAIGDIKKALSAYDHLGKEVLKDAIDEYICHSITED